MQQTSLKTILRKQHIPKLIFPLLLFIVSVVCIIINPFKEALKPTPISSLSEIEVQHDLDNHYIKCTIPKLYYTGLDYSVGGKTKANIYYTLTDDICYYVIIAANSNNGIATTLENFSLSAKLTKNDAILEELTKKIANEVNFSVEGLKEITCEHLISQYDYNKDFTRFALIALVIIAVLSGILLIFEIISTANSYMLAPVLRLRKYGNRKELFDQAVSEFDTAKSVGNNSTYITQSFLVIVTRTDTDILPIENISWIYDFNELHHKKGKTKMFHPLCIITDTKKLYKIKHLSDKGLTEVVNALIGKHPEILVGYSH